ncbi:MAG: hypothetical protein K0Q73_6131, partial [Paenibacillus sp.]|nr:hypothetical protein [Paenibacillus sp.]
IIHDSLHRSGCNLHDVEPADRLATIHFGDMANPNRFQPGEAGLGIHFKMNASDKRRCFGF